MSGISLNVSQGLPTGGEVQARREAHLLQSTCTSFHHPGGSLPSLYNAGIAKGVWQPTQFNEYGTPVVPFGKTCLPGQPVCGVYSVTVNQQLESHRHTMPLSKDLMRNLGGGNGFT